MLHEKRFQDPGGAGNSSYPRRRGVREIGSTDDDGV